MSQQSLTFLSQPANLIKAKPKVQGGTSYFTPGVAGNLTLKYATLDKKADFQATKQAKIEADAANRPLRLAEFHYSTSRKIEQERQQLGVLDIPPKPVASLPGYSGFIPRKEAANIIGASQKKCNMAAAEVFATEQVVWRERAANQMGPEKTLKTPGFVQN